MFSGGFNHYKKCRISLEILILSKNISNQDFNFCTLFTDISTISNSYYWMNFLEKNLEISEIKTKVHYNSALKM